MVELLKAVHLSKAFDGRKVVNDVSFAFGSGQVVGILGPNGAGKTTAFYMIAGLIQPDVGEIYLDNECVTDLPIYMRAKRGIVYLPQESSIFRGLSVEENIRVALEVNVKDSDAQEHLLEKLLGMFSIEHLRNAPASALSGGERRRLEIARALACQPQFILLDEPLAGVDPIAVSEIKAIIKMLKTQGIGVIITDHNVREALDIVDYAYVVHEGKIIATGNANEIVNNEIVKRHYLGQNFVIYND